MKVYMAYLLLSENDFNRLNVNIIGNLWRLHTLENGMKMGIYAYTNDKATFDMFSNEHNIGKNKFLVKRIVKLDESGYHDLLERYPYAELSMYRIHCGKNLCTWIPLTTDEYHNITSSKNEIISELIMDIVTVDYGIFSKDIIDALEDIFYCYYRDIWYGDDDAVDARSFNASFGICPDALWNNQLGLFIFLYKDFISVENIRDDVISLMEVDTDNGDD